MAEDKIFFEIRPSREGDQTPEAFSAIFSALASQKPSFWDKIVGRVKPLVFEIASYNKLVRFYAILPVSIAPYFESQVYAQYPNVSLIQADDYLSNATGKIFCSRIALSSKSYLPIKTWKDFVNTDPLSSILASMGGINEGEILVFQIVAIPSRDSWRSEGIRVIARGVVGTDGVSRSHPKAALIEKKISQEGFCVGLRLLAYAENETRAKTIISNLAGSFGSLSLGESNSLVLSGPPKFRKKAFMRAILNRSPNFISCSQVLTVDEMATIYHLPTSKQSGILNINWGGRIGGEAPQNLPIGLGKSEGEKRLINFFARTEFKNKNIVFGIKKEDRQRHIYIVGKTGTGKTTLIANMAINDMRNGEGIAVVDPHGDLSEILLDYVPSYRINDVAYLDAATAAKKAFRMNLFEIKNPEQGELVASGVVSIFQKLYGYSWGPRLEYILRNAINTLILRSNSTLVDVPKILTDREFRRRVVDQLRDPVLKNFWVNEFEKMGDKLQAEAISPILNKVGQFVSSPTIREIIGYPASTVDLEEIMNRGKILILNLSQGRLGEDNAALLGAMIITKIQLAAMSRASMAEKERRDFYLYVDEFQNFATTSFIKILSEARKYKLNLIVANQYIGQISEDVQKAVFGNVGTLISFLVGAQDSHILTKEFGDVYKERDLVSLDNYQIILKMAIEGKTSRPFSAYTLPLPKNKNQNRSKILKVSEERYTREAKLGQVNQTQKYLKK